MKTVLHNPGNEQPIEELYAYISVDQNGNEGLCAAPLLDSEPTTPLVFGYERVALKFLPVVEAIQKLAPDMKIRLVKFTNREVITTIGGGRQESSNERSSYDEGDEASP